MLTARLKLAEQFKSKCQVIRLMLEDDDKQNPAALMIQRQFKVYQFRKQVGKLIEARQKKRNNSAVMI